MYVFGYFTFAECKTEQEDKNRESTEAEKLVTHRDPLQVLLTETENHLPEVTKYPWTKQKSQGDKEKTINDPKVGHLRHQEVIRRVETVITKEGTWTEIQIDIELIRIGQEVGHQGKIGQEKDLYQEVSQQINLGQEVGHQLFLRVETRHSEATGSMTESMDKRGQIPGMKGQIPGTRHSTKDTGQGQGKIIEKTRNLTGDRTEEDLVHQTEELKDRIPGRELGMTERGQGQAKVMELQIKKIRITLTVQGMRRVREIHS